MPGGEDRLCGVLRAPSTPPGPAPPTQSQLKSAVVPEPHLTPLTSPSPGCRVRGWRARHSLQVRRRRHSSGERGIGEQGGTPQPSLQKHEAWLITPSQAPSFLLPPSPLPGASWTPSCRPPCVSQTGLSTGFTNLLLPHPTW